MDALYSLFDTIACVGDVIGRCSEKAEELSTLVTSTESVSQSVRTFAASLPLNERDAVYHSNKVFQAITEQLQRCTTVISKYHERQLAITSQSAHEQSGQLEDNGTVGMRQVVTSKLKGAWTNSSRTLQEGMEVLGSKLGARIGVGLLRLPEDELLLIRQASTELNRLVPQLNLALHAYTAMALRGEKRVAPDPSDVARPAQMQRISGVECLAVSVADVAAGSDILAVDSRSSSSSAVPASPMFTYCTLQFVSDAEVAKKMELPVLTTRDLRPPSRSTSSLDLTTSVALANEDLTSGPVADCSTTSTLKDGVVTLVCGRQDVIGKVPRDFVLPTKKAGGELRPVHHFISRNVFALQVFPKLPAESQTQTLQWGVPTQPEPDERQLLAIVSGLLEGGLHIREGGETTWRWVDKGEQANMHEGDRIALLLESPPGSSQPGPPRELSATDATCLLGLEFKSP